MTRRVRTTNPAPAGTGRPAPEEGRNRPAPARRCAAPGWLYSRCRAPAAATIGEPGHEVLICEQHVRQAHEWGLAYVLGRTP